MFTQRAFGHPGKAGHLAIERHSATKNQVPSTSKQQPGTRKPCFAPNRNSQVSRVNWYLLLVVAKLHTPYASRKIPDVTRNTQYAIRNTQYAIL